MNLAWKRKYTQLPLGTPVVSMFHASHREPGVQEERDVEAHGCMVQFQLKYTERGAKWQTHR